MLDVVRLRALVAVARTGSVTEAARELGYAQPSVSHHLSRLEAEVGLELTRRDGRGIRLTDVGALLAQRGAEILGRLDATEQELAAVAGLRAGRLRVAGFQSALATVVAAAAATLRAAAPGIELSLVDLHPELALRQLREGGVDVAVVFRYDDETPDDVRMDHLFDDPMYLVSRTPGETITDNRDSDWIAGCERCRRELVDACAEVGVTPRITYTSDDPAVKQAMVAAGLGVTEVPGLSLAMYRAPGVEATEMPHFRRRIYVATFGDRPHPPATAAFLEALAETAATRTRGRGNRRTGPTG